MTQFYYHTNDVLPLSDELDQWDSPIYGEYGNPEDFPGFIGWCHITFTEISLKGYVNGECPLFKCILCGIVKSPSLMYLDPQGNICKQCSTQ